MAYYSNPNADNPGSAVPVTTSSTPVVSENSQRQELVITNDSDTVIYLRLAASGAAVGAGIRLNPDGGSFTQTEPWIYTGPICAIHGSTGNKNLTVAEV